MTEKVMKSGDVIPFPLQQGGEKLDVLVRVDDNERGYYFNLVFVEKQDWPKEKKSHLRRIFYGFDRVEDPIHPYPVKLRFQLDSADDKSNVHVERVRAERKSAYSTYYPSRGKGSDIWRAHAIHGAVLEPGLYRVRIENLNPCPDFDFETLFQFERDNRRY